MSFFLNLAISFKGDYILSRQQASWETSFNDCCVASLLVMIKESSGYLSNRLEPPSAHLRAEMRCCLFFIFYCLSCIFWWFWSRITGTSTKLFLKYLIIFPKLLLMKDHLSSLRSWSLIFALLQKMIILHRD